MRSGPTPLPRPWHGLARVGPVYTAL